MKVDTDRMIGGQEMYESMTRGVRSGSPWFAFLRPDGQVVATSFGEGGDNLGCPWTEQEVGAFKTILGKVTTEITAAEIDAITSELGDKAGRGD